jgi:hypothetical protein
MENNFANSDEFCLEKLKDISKIKIDTASPVTERMVEFIKEINNPYVFMVNKTPVKVVFSAKNNSQSFEKSMENIVKKYIG